MGVKFKTIEGGNKISSDGKVYNKDGKELYVEKNAQNGYPQAKITVNGHRKNIDIHRALGKFLKGKGEVINHDDGNKKHSSVNNLTKMTQSQNIQHAYDTGLESHTKNRHMKESLLETVIQMYGGIVPLINIIEESASSDINFIHKAHEPNGQLYGFTQDEEGNQIEHSKLSKAEEYYNISKQFISEKGVEEHQRATQELSKLHQELAKKSALLHDIMLGMYITDRKTFDENGKLVKIPEKQWAEMEQQQRQAFDAEIQNKMAQGDTLLSNGPEGLANYYNQYSQPLDEELPQQQEQIPQETQPKKKVKK